MASVGGEEQVYRASVTAPVNIAVIKYWGKRDAKLNLPTNSSVSVTLSQDDLKAHTTATCSPRFKEDKLLLGKVPQKLDSPRTAACLAALRALRRDVEATDPRLPPLSSYPLFIVSENNFPTAAGLASSAAGFAALVFAIAKLYELPTGMQELSRIARQGSGSACRSLFGGYVAWNMGERTDGLDSQAELIIPQADWPSMRALILVANAGPKAIGSSVGMQMTVQTSTLFQERAARIVPGRMRSMTEAIRGKNFGLFADLTMKDSNNFHATCLDTSPPIIYMNDVSHSILMLVHRLNTSNVIAAYTCDAGPNVVIYYEEKNRLAILGVFAEIFKDTKLSKCKALKDVTPTGIEELDSTLARTVAGGVSDLIGTAVGDGPRVVNDHLVTASGQMVG